MSSASPACISGPAPTALAIVEHRPLSPIGHSEDSRYTVRPEWCSPGESLWMRLSKFSYLNRMPVGETARLFARQGDRPLLSGVDMRRPEPWDLAQVASVLEVGADDVRASFCSHAASAIAGTRVRACPELRYCPLCLQVGFHAAWFQWHPVERCPVHNARIRRGCPQCNASIPYVLGSALTASSLRCLHCRHHWVPRLQLPRGHCSALPARHVDLMRRWALCVQDLVGLTEPGAGASARRYVGACKTSKPTGRPKPHILTLFNRLFDEPPPTISTLATTRRGALALSHRLRHDTVASNDPHLVDYRHRLWPHFAADFELFESVVRGERTTLFKDAARDGALAGLRLLLHNNLVVPTSTLDSATAAALGWSVSWFGLSRLLATHPTDAFPARGLTAWLARIPVRPPSLSESAWPRQVQEWLVDDLARSAQLWRELAAFMSTRHHYVLRGDAASPAVLAAMRSARGTGESQHYWNRV